MSARWFLTIGVVVWTASVPVWGQPTDPRGACVGDIDDDGQVGLYDLATLLGSFGTCAGDAAFDSRTDLTEDGCVSLPDLATMLANYGALCLEITAQFRDGVLTVTGGEADNVIVVSRDAAGNILVNGGAVPISWGPATISNTTLIRMLGLAGNDELRLDEANGPLPRAEIFGGEGTDQLVGGSGDDRLDGDQGADSMAGGGGADTLVWDPGDGSDVVEGGAGEDTLLFNGAGAAETVEISANGSRVRFFRNPGNIVMDCNDVEQVTFNALGGADNITVGDMSGTDLTSVALDLGTGGAGDGAADTVTVNGTQGDDVFGAFGDAGGVTVFGVQAAVSILFAEPAGDRLTLNGLGGDDVVDASSLEADAIALTINGGLGDDVMLGSEGNDTIFGGDGADLGLMGAGDDTFVWNPGDDNDTIEGQSGHDTMLFNGANVSEVVNIFANGGRVLFTRNVASVVMDCNDVERMDFNALGGTDQVIVNDLSGTDVTEIRVDLGSPADSGTGDGQPDTVTVNATSGDDVVVIAGDASGTSVLGLAAQVQITGSEAANDRVVINALAGDDAVDASGLGADAIGLTIDGGDDNDVLIGGDGADVIFGGNGDDVLIGGPGVDTLDGGPGDNVVIQ